MQLSPDTKRTQVWKNLHTAWASEETKSTWYSVVHDKIRTMSDCTPFGLWRPIAADIARDKTPLHTV